MRPSAQSFMMLNKVLAEPSIDWLKIGNPVNFHVALNAASDDLQYEILAALLSDKTRGFEVKHFNSFPLL